MSFTMENKYRLWTGEKHYVERNYKYTDYMVIRKMGMKKYT